MAQTKLFDPCGSATWYLAIYDSFEKMAFGYVTGMTQDEWGYVSLVEVGCIEWPVGLVIESDLSFVRKRVSRMKNI